MQDLRTILGTVGVATLLLAACGDDGAASNSGDSGGSTGASGSGSGNETTPAGTDGPLDCLPGKEDCVCLDTECVGALFCVDQVCLPGPTVDADDTFEVIGGVRVALEVELTADAHTWSQVAGPTVELLDTEGTTPLVDIPPDAPAGEVVTIRLTSMRNGVPADFDINITILDAVFENTLPKATLDDLGTSAAVDFRGDTLWVSSTEGFVSVFDADKIRVSKFDVPGSPFGTNFGRLAQGEDNIDVLYFANPMNQSVEAMVVSSGQVLGISSTSIDATPLGTVTDIAVDDGNVYFTNGDAGQIFAYDAETQETRLFAEGLGTTANAIRFGPEPSTLYVGVLGQVVRLPILNDGIAGEPSVYLDFGATDDPMQTVDGIEFDSAGTLYVGNSGTQTLYMARLSSGQTEVVRSFSGVGVGILGFSGLRFGRGDFDDRVLYWANGDGMSVGQLRVGVRR